MQMFRRFDTVFKQNHGTFHHELDAQVVPGMLTNNGQADRCAFTQTLSKIKLALSTHLSIYIYIHVDYVYIDINRHMRASFLSMTNASSLHVDRSMPIHFQTIIVYVYILYIYTYIFTYIYIYTYIHT